MPTSLAWTHSGTATSPPRIASSRAASSQSGSPSSSSRTASRTCCRNQPASPSSLSSRSRAARSGSSPRKPRGRYRCSSSTRRSATRPGRTSSVIASRKNSTTRSMSKWAERSLPSSLSTVPSEVELPWPFVPEPEARPAPAATGPAGARRSPARAAARGGPGRSPAGAGVRQCRGGARGRSGRLPAGIGSSGARRPTRNGRVARRPPPPARPRRPWPSRSRSRSTSAWPVTPGESAAASDPPPSTSRLPFSSRRRRVARPASRESTRTVLTGRPRAGRSRRRRRPARGTAPRRSCRARPGRAPPTARRGARPRCCGRSRARGPCRWTSS